MRRKKRSRKGREQKSNQEKVPNHRAAMEKMMADLGRLLEERNFGSVDEANAFLQQLMVSGQPIPSAGSRTPLEQAQELMYEAWEATGKRRVKLAREALAISEDCADAYVLLAEESAKSLEEARDIYEAGVRAGERALGPEAFEEYEGHFWGVLETRPYMRARAGLASSLWQLGQRREAIEHYQEMLRLNPGDNQGIRYTLLTSLLEVGRNADAKKLLAEHEDDAMAMWRYNGALLLFREEGASREATAQLREAVQYNPHVPEYLLGRKRMPRQLPPYVGFGDEAEAAYYVAEAGELWRQEEGAVDWLRQVADELSSRSVIM